MKNLPKKIKELEIDFPDTLHGKIMKKLLFLRFRTPFIIIFVLLCTNLTFSTWYIFQKMSELNTFAVFRSLLYGFEFSFAYAVDFAKLIFDAIPIMSIIVFGINLLLMASLLYVSYGLKKFLLSKVFSKVES